ncbi:MAG: SMP-30/gluconolactonase/LRE family protein [Bacteroidales bacterium]
MNKPRTIILLLPVLAILISCSTKSIIAPGSQLQKFAGGLKFTEGPVYDNNGHLYFSDLGANIIYKSSSDGQLSVFRNNSNGSNGLDIDSHGNIVACEGMGRRLVSINQAGVITVLTDNYHGKHFNSPNDLWIDPKGGIYFTDPYYGPNPGSLEQGGQYVFYLSPDHKTVIKVIDNLQQPNGIVGTPDGKLLYVADYKGEETHVYTINGNGTLTHKALFAPKGSDGMELDNKGNLYLTKDNVKIYNSKGNLLETIKVPEITTNVCFGGKDKSTLYITARTSVYSINMRTHGN